MLKVSIHTDGQQKATGHQIVRNPEKGLVLQTNASPHLIVPLQFETWKDFVAKEEETKWLKEGKVIYTRDTIIVTRPVTFYYLNVK